MLFEIKRVHTAVWHVKTKGQKSTLVYENKRGQTPVWFLETKAGKQFISESQVKRLRKNKTFTFEIAVTMVGLSTNGIWRIPLPIILDRITETEMPKDHKQCSEVETIKDHKQTCSMLRFSFFDINDFRREKTYPEEKICDLEDIRRFIQDRRQNDILELLGHDSRH